MKGVGIDPAVGQPGRQLVSPKPCPHENQRLVTLGPAELGEQDVALVGIADQHGALADGVDGLAGPLGLDRHRIGQEGLGEAFHLVRHCGREEHRLAGLGQGFENAPDRRQEAQINHLVAFIKDKMLDIAKIDLATGHQVLEAARGGDQNIDALFQRPELMIVALTTDNGQIARLQAAGEGLDAVRHLIGKLARRHQNQNARAPRCAGLAFLKKPVQKRQQIGRRLAGTRLRQPDQVAPLQDHRNGVALDRRRDGQPLRRDVINNARRQPKLEERIALEGRLIALGGQLRHIVLLHLVTCHLCPFRCGARTEFAARRHPSTTAHEGSHRC